MSYKCLALGDIALEVRANIAEPFTHIHSHRIYQLPVDLRAGGTATHFALYAHSLLGQSTLAGIVGDDTSGRFILNELQQSNIELSISVESDCETSKIVMVYDGSSPVNNRSLIINNPNANDKFSEKHLDLCKDQLLNTDFLFVSGYNSRSEPRWSTSQKAMELVHQRGGIVVFDLVPHDLYKTIALNTLVEWTKHVSVLVSEVATLRRFLQLGHPSELINRDIVEQTSKAFLEVFPALILGYGPNNYEYQCIATQNEISFAETGFPDIPIKAGIGEWLVVNAIQKLSRQVNNNFHSIRRNTE